MVEWNRFPQVEKVIEAQRWLQIQEHLGLAPNTVQAYGRALEDYLRVCQQHSISILTVTREHVALFVQDMRTRAREDGAIGLSNATIQQRLTAVRLFYDFLVEEGLRSRNPVGRGSYTPGRADTSHRGLVPRQRRLPWIPTNEQWIAILEAPAKDSIRNRTMLAFAYDAALRREELCALAISDIDPAYHLIHIRAETTKNQQARVVPYSTATDQLYQDYLQHRRTLSRARGALFLSESRRNSTQPLSIWTWSKVVHGLAQRAEVSPLTTHTFRHLCLTDLARAGWDIHEIARFAGHRSIQSTLTYIHLSGRDLAAKLAQGMNEIHAWRVAQMTEVWS